MIRSTLLIAGAFACALPAHAGPVFLSIEYTGDVNIGPHSFTGVPIAVQAKGITEDITSQTATPGTILTLPISMVITVDGLGSFDIYNDLYFFAFVDIGFGGFGTSLRDASFLFVAPDLTGYDFTTSILSGPMPDGGGIPAQILNTTLGHISIGAASPGTFTSVVHNPTPGTATALGLTLAPVALRRRRAGRSG